MVVEFQFERRVGSIEYSIDGSISVKIENHPELAERIREYFSRKFVVFSKFSNPGIPGKMKVLRSIDCEDDFKIALSRIEEEIDIWIHSPKDQATKWKSEAYRELTAMPWFGTKGFKLVKWNGNDVTPWWVIEDLATGIQAFYEPNSFKYSELEWFRKPIALSGLVDHWDEYGEEFRRLEDISYTQDWAK